jgi:hypothetical protein
MFCKTSVILYPLAGTPGRVEFAGVDLLRVLMVDVQRCRDLVRQGEPDVVGRRDRAGERMSVDSTDGAVVDVRPTHAMNTRCPACSCRLLPALPGQLGQDRIGLLT